MSGAAWAAFSGLGFGVFQSLNRRTVLGVDVSASTFVLLAIAGVILAAASVATGDVHELSHASSSGLAWFAVAGVLHFFGGWTFLSLSQARIGAARTSPLVSIAPVFGVLIAVVTIHELPSAAELAAIVVVLAGVYLVALEKLQDSSRPAVRARRSASAPRSAGPISPVLIKHGLRGLHSPLLGVTIGMICALAVYAVALAVTGRRVRLAAPGQPLLLQLLAGLFVGLSVWSRWYALDSATIGVVLALGLLSVPVVATLAPLVVGRVLERITPRIVLGSAFVVAGALALVLVS